MKVMGIFISNLVEEQNWHKLFVLELRSNKNLVPICRIFDEKILFAVYISYMKYTIIEK